MKNISWQKIWPHVIAVGIFLVIAVFYCKPALEGKVLQQSDVQQWKGIAESSFKYKETHGHFPLWVNSLFSGMPGYQVAMDSYNPITLGYFHPLFHLFLPPPISFFFLLCVSFYFLTQVLKIDYRIGILASIGYAYASFTPIIVAVGHITQVQTMGYVPAMLGAIFLVFRKKYWSGAALSALFASLLIGMNHLQITYYFLLVAFFAFVAYLIYWIKIKEYKHIIITCCVLAFAAIVGVLTNMVSIATTYDYSKATLRGGSAILDTSKNGTTQSSGLPIDYAFMWSYGQAETFSLLVPNVYGGSSESSQLGASSHLGKELINKGVPDDQVEQITDIFPTYWGQQPFTSGPVYLGAVICFLFIFGLVYLKGFDKWWIAAICFLAVLMAWGKNFMGFNSFLFDHFPLYNKFRVPTMALFIPQLLFPLLGALALQRFIFEEKDKEFAQKKLRVSGYVMLGVFVIVGLLYMSFDFKGADDSRIISMLTQMTQNNKDVANSLYNAFKQDRQSLFGSDLLRSLFFAGAAFLLLWLFIKNKIKASYAIIGVVLLGSIDVIAEGRRYLNSDRFIEPEAIDENYFKPTPANEQILRDTSYYRVFNLTVGDPFADASTSYFHNSVGGYHPAKLSIMEDLLNFQLRKQPINLHVLDMLNTKYFIVPGPQNQSAAQLNPNAAGPCWFVKTIVYRKSPAEIMQALNNFNPKDTAFVEDASKSKIEFTPVPDSTASIRLIKNDNDLITYESSSRANQFAVFSEIYYDRGWKAYIDDKEAPIVQTDYVLRGLSVPSGNHNIRFEFKPSSYYNSLKLEMVGSALGWLAIIAAVVHGYRRRKNVSV